MSLFAIADLHLSLGVSKPMDVFRGWEGYVQKITDNWNEKVGNNDMIVIAGDISWAMNLEQAIEDFRFLHNLPGKKIILKGNHDYWFETKTKTEKFLHQNGFDSIQILFNNAFIYNDKIICGTRGWINETMQENLPGKITNREAGRLKLSLDAGRELQEKSDTSLETIVFMHYPPIYSTFENKTILNILYENEIKKCYYGHLHGRSVKDAVIGKVRGIEYNLISCDYIQFSPIKVSD